MDPQFSGRIFPASTENNEKNMAITAGHHGILGPKYENSHNFSKSKQTLTKQLAS